MENILSKFLSWNNKGEKGSKLNWTYLQIRQLQEPFVLSFLLLDRSVPEILSFKVGISSHGWDHLACQQPHVALPMFWCQLGSWILKRMFTSPTCHMSCVMCHMSCVMCHVSHVTCHMSHLDRRQLGLVREEGTLWTINIWRRRKRVVTLEIQVTSR